MSLTQFSPRASVRLLVGVAAVGALLASACAPKPVAAPTAPRQPVALSVTAAPVKRADIQQQLSYSGEIRAKSQVTVLPKASGRVDQMLVDVGSRVKAGDTLAVLEQDSLQIQTLQAQATLAGAQAKLGQVQAGAKPEDVAAAQAGLIQQQVRLDNMKAGGRAEDIALAEATLDAQQAKLELLQQGGRAEAVDSAQAGLDAANAKLASVQKGATNDLRQGAQSAVDADRAALASAQSALMALNGSGAADLQTAQSAVEQAHAAQTPAERAAAAAEAAYQAAVAQRDAAQAAVNQTSNPLEAQIAQAKAGVTAAQAQDDSAKAQLQALQAGAALGPCQKVNGARVDDNSCNAAQTAANTAIDAADQAVTAAQAQYNLLANGGSPLSQAQVKAGLAQAEAGIKQGDTQRAQAQANLTAAREQSKVAEARLAALKNGGLEAQRQAAQAQVVAAQERLKTDQARLDQIAQGPQAQDIQQAQALLQQAEDQLALATQPAMPQDIRAQQDAVRQAQLNLDKARSPYTTYDVRQQEQAVAQAQATLDGRQAPYTDQDRQAAQAAVDQAQAALDLARLGLKEATVVAPVDGVVADRQAAPGALVSPQTPIVTLVPPDLELVVNVEEAQLGKVAEGQQVALTVPAYPDETFSGVVKAIAPTIDSKSRTASVRVEPENGAGKLRAGMFAHLDITTASKQAALIAPRDALVGTPSGSQGFVFTVGEGNRVQRVSVRLGLISDTTVEILSGVQEGQIVATSSLADLSDGDVVQPQVETKTALAR